MNLHKEILRLAGPSILANITVPLVGMVDIAVVGHLGGSEGAALIGGISIGTMLFDLLYWNFSFLRTGTGGLTAQGHGRGDNTEGILFRGLRLAALIGTALIALQWAAVWLAFQVVDCTPQVQELATRYFHICIWAAPAALSLFVFKGWFIGEQDSVRPMTADLLVNGLNIVLSLWLGFGPLGFAGVAWGTVIAQWIGLAYCAVAAKRRYAVVYKYLLINPFQKSIGSASADKFSQEAHTQRVSSHAKLDFDLFLRSVGMVAVYVGFTMLSARFGDVMLAVSAILMKLLMIFSYFTDGFAYAGEALTGRFIGEQRADGVRSAVQQTFAWSAGVAAVFILLYWLGGVPLLRLMTSDTSVVEAGKEFLPWLLLMPLIGCPVFTWDGIYTGATASKDLRNSILLCLVGFFGCWYAGQALLDLTPRLAIHLLMGAYFIHLAIRTVYLTLRSRKAIFSDISSR